MRSMLCLSALLAAVVPGCGNGDFKDCAVSCTTTTGCPDGFSCSAEGMCRIAGAFGECGDHPFPDAPEVDADPGGSARFDFTGEIETYVVPAGVSQLRLVVGGASGGDTGTFVGGYGAVVDTIVTVTPGDRLSIIVGEKPLDQVAGMDGCGASGGGGSFVIDDAGDPLAVAGGGGGATGYRMVDGADASISTSGRSSTVAGGTSGSGGSGIPGTEGGGGGGGGFLTAGGSGELATGGGSFATGALGGRRDSTEMCGTTAIGGFGGGGGGGRDAGAGGGGYSGGAARDSAMSTIKAGGGGSFGGGTSPDISIRTTHGHGSILITPL